MRREYVGGASLSGLAHREVSRLLAPFGLTWSIQDGRLQIFAETTVRSGEAWRIDVASGMLGSPEWSSPPSKGKKPNVVARCQLFPQLTPGDRVELSSSTISGVFKLESVSHKGDTRDRDFETELEGSPV